PPSTHPPNSSPTLIGSSPSRSCGDTCSRGDLRLRSSRCELVPYTGRGRVLTSTPSKSTCPWYGLASRRGLLPNRRLFERLVEHAYRLLASPDDPLATDRAAVVWSPASLHRSKARTGRSHRRALLL